MDEETGQEEINDQDPCDWECQTGDESFEADIKEHQVWTVFLVSIIKIFVLTTCSCLHIQEI